MVGGSERQMAGSQVSPTTVLDLRELHKSLKQIPLLHGPAPGLELRPGQDEDGQDSRKGSSSRSKSRSKSRGLSSEQPPGAAHLAEARVVSTMEQPGDGQQTTKRAAVLSGQATHTARARDVLARSKHRQPARLRPQWERERDRYPFCLVWTPLPVVSWFVPLLGHTGIANSAGLIYDFSDHFQVSVDNFSFGAPTKYYQFDPAEIPQADKAAAWDAAISAVSEQYCKMRHNFCFNNCHQHVAAVLNKVRYANATDWTQTDVCRLITLYSSYTGFLGFLRQWWPTLIIVLALVVFASLASM